jgi:aspartyl-tRNA(Asn)/glutamyl-tRNA(Gln) amidotransferase subunit A
VSTADAITTARQVQARETSALEVARHALDAADRHKGLNAFISTFPDETLAAAAEVDRRVAAGERLSLAGVPIAVKDNICLGPPYGGRTTCGSRMLERYQSPYTATALQKLIDAGAVVVGKTNMDEFGMGSSTERSAFGPTRNPHDPSRVPGGSSGGSAAAVAAGIVPVALGSDTGGSIRQPASHCGVVGVKPTYGRVSRYGLVAYASSLDQIGPLAGSVRDTALVLEALCGVDPRDATTAHHAPPGLVACLEEPVKDLVVGVPRQVRSAGNHAGVTGVMDATLERLRAEGATIVEIDLPLLDEAIAAYYIIAPAEASSNLARFDGIRYGHRAELKAGEGLYELYCRSRAEGFGPEVKRRIMLGTHVLSSGYYEAYYNTALKVRRRVLNDFNGAFAGGAGHPACHVILMPAAPGPAFRIGEKTTDPMAMYLEDVYTVAVNLAGLPAACVPCGFAEVEGVRLPVGMQLIAPAFDECGLMRAGAMVERAQSMR